VQAPPSIVNRLQDALRGRRAAQRFLDAVARSGLRNRWADFKRDAATEAMRIWLREMGIPTTEDGD
jgi:aspartate aminotransferase-like enzyme